MDRGSFFSAETELKLPLALDRGLAEIFNSLGVCATMRNAFPEARGYLEKALGLKPRYREAKNNLEYVRGLAEAG